jgi:glycosyltransferase involved in cell wall biosynthesis
MSERKKRVFIQTDYVLAKTGFGKNARAVFEYLYATGKYELINFAVGSVDVQINPEADRTPWKTLAAVQANQLEQIKRQNDPKAWENIERMAGYGAFALDQAVRNEKPDVFFGIQDIWGIDFAVDKPWFKKIPSVLWTTLDSLPILPKAVELAPKIEHYWSWADFATQALHKLGHKHVKTLRGAIDTKSFYRLTDKQRADLRKRFGIPDDTFIIGFVFRNQLRKSVPNLIQGYRIFKRDNPQLKTRLLLHTCWVEGWDIPKLLQEHDIKQEEVITTYVCKHCRNYHVRPFVTNDENCNHCGAEKQQVTTHPSIGVTEAQLNEVYNLMDVYSHPFTSGGQEIPIQEAKLTELVTLVTNYSCGEDCCVPEANSLPLDWSEYREPGTQFIKASTYPSSIAKQLNKVLKMKPEQRREMGKAARQWVLDNFSIEVIGKQLEAFIDAAPYATDATFDFKDEAKDPYFKVPAITDDTEWLICLYRNILKFPPIDKTHDGVNYWLNRLKDGVPREEIDKFFRQTAFAENQKMGQKGVAFEDLLNAKDKGRVLVVQPESAGDIFLITALFPSIKRRYPDWALYVATKAEYRDIVEGNPYVDKWLEYNPMMDNLIWLEGNAGHNGYFNIAYQPYLQTQRNLSYLHNGQDTLDFEIQA